MGLIYHVAALPLYKNAADAKLESTLLSAGVFIMGPKELFRLFLNNSFDISSPSAPRNPTYREK